MAALARVLFAVDSHKKKQAEPLGIPA